MRVCETEDPEIVISSQVENLARLHALIGGFHNIQ
jgi:hypothetical protein